MRTPPVDWEEEDLVFFGIGGQLVRQGVEEDMVLLARTSTTSAVPSSLSALEEVLGPAAVASFTASCKYKSTKHGLDK